MHRSMTPLIAALASAVCLSAGASHAAPPEACVSAWGKAAVAACTAEIAAGGDLGPRALAVLYSKRARGHYASDGEEAARKDYDTAIGLDPEYAGAWIGRAETWPYSDADGRALDDYTQALRLDPKNVAAYSGRARANAAKFRFGPAKADADIALTTEPRNMMALLSHGLVVEEMGDWRGAVDDFTAALAPDADVSMFHTPPLPLAHSYRAEAYAVLGNRDPAMADLDQAIAAKPDDADFRFRRGILRYYGADYAGARDDLGKAAELEPRDGFTAIWLELANRRAGAPSVLAAAAGKLVPEAWSGRYDSWPKPVVDMLFGNRTAEDLLANGTDPTTRIDKAGLYLASLGLRFVKKASAVDWLLGTFELNNRRRACDANLFVAETLRIAGKDDRATEHFRAAERLCEQNYDFNKAALRSARDAYGIGDRT